MNQQQICFLPAIEPGGDDMIKAELWHEIHSRFKLKEKKKSIARTIGLSVQTVRKILRQKQPKAYDRKKQESELLGSYQDYILRLRRLLSLDSSLYRWYNKLEQVTRI
jgi:hypothetical protein